MGILNQLKGVGGGLVKFAQRILRITVDQDNGGYIEINSRQVYALATAITAGDSTTAPAGSIGWTTNATGKRQLFVSDGTYWQDYYGQESSLLNLSTIATTSTTNGYTSAPFTGKLIAAVFIGVEALAASDTNYLTFGLTNLGQDGLGTTAMLAATNANTSKVTGGTALAANTKRDLTLHGTAGNLAATKYDRLKFGAAATGTLGSTITGGVVILIWQRTI